MIQSVPHKLSNIAEAMLWHGHVRLLLEPGHWCLLMMRLLIEAGTVKCEVFGAARIQPNPAKMIGQRFRVQMENDTKQSAKGTREFLEAEK